MGLRHSRFFVTLMVGATVVTPALAAAGASLWTVSLDDGDFSAVLGANDVVGDIHPASVGDDQVNWVGATGADGALGGTGSSFRYVTNGTSRLTVTLPAVCSVGDTVKVMGLGSGGFSRWECDDYTGNASYTTLHQVWVR